MAPKYKGAVCSSLNHTTHLLQMSKASNEYDYETKCNKAGNMFTTQKDGLGSNFCTVYNTPSFIKTGRKMWMDMWAYFFLVYNITGKQDAQLSQRDRAAGCVIVFPKSRRLELGDNILRTV